MTFYEGPIDPPGFPFYGYGDHLLTASEEEKDDAQVRWGYEYERIAGYVYPRDATGSGRIPLYRYSNGNTPCGDHYYSLGRDVRAESAGYNFERVECMAFGRTETPDGIRVMAALYLPWNGDHFYSWLGVEVEDARNNHDYVWNGRDAIGSQAFGVYRDPSKPGLIPLHRLVRTKEWE